ncbi:hypothetical protein BSKO_01610 [Bryopsis sp. KO-2023]|nr:hypothetical protein BSKO_01610 [Bryopsis sp. KO-2023]
MALRRAAARGVGLSRTSVGYWETCFEAGGAALKGIDEKESSTPGNDERRLFRGAREISGSLSRDLRTSTVIFDTYARIPSCSSFAFYSAWPASRFSVHSLASLRRFSAQPQPVEDVKNSTGNGDENREGGVEASGKDPPSPEDVDKAVDNYDKLLEKMQQLSYPPTYQPWSQKIAQGIKTIFWFIIGLPKMIASGAAAPFRKGWWGEQWKHIKEGGQHYWVGAKLLGADVRIASRLMLKTASGKELSRREHRQLTRTVSDIFRLVPMIIFLVVPFLEFLLPVVLKLFPKMLPSTFEDKLKQQEELKKRLAVKLEVARFLQDTVAVMARDLKKKRTGETQASAAELYQFMKEIRGGKPVDSTDIIRFAQLFNDEMTLDNLERVQLVSMCQFVGLSPFGTDNFLRTRLRAHLGGIKRDDRDIRSEGIESMTLEELKQACRARGMRTPYGEGARQFMERQMEEWLEHSLDRALPSSLLLLSRAFTVTLPTQDQKKKKQIQLDNIKQTLSTLPPETFLTEGDVEDNKSKLEYLKREEKLIQEEAEARRAEELKVEEEVVPESTATAQEMAASTTAATIFQAAEAQLLKDALDESDEERALKLAATREAKLKKVLSALTVLASTSGVSNERSKFMELVKREVDRIQEEMAQKGGASLRFTGGRMEAWRPAEMEAIPGEHVSKRLSDRVSVFLHSIEKEMDDVDVQIGEHLHLIDLDGDGMISREELKTALGFLKEQLGGPELNHLLEELCNATEKDSQINVKELMAIANERLETTKPEGTSS